MSYLIKTIDDNEPTIYGRTLGIIVFPIVLYSYLYLQRKILNGMYINNIEPKFWEIIKEMPNIDKFELKLKYKEYLVEGDINGELNNAFNEKNHYLSDKTKLKLSKIDKKHWEIVDKTKRYKIFNITKRYIIEETDSNLFVYNL